MIKIERLNLVHVSIKVMNVCIDTVARKFRFAIFLPQQTILKKIYFSSGYLDFTGVCNFDVDGEIISCKDQIIEIFLISSSLYK